MSKISYEAYAKRYETTTPIRGRSTDVRPIGQRRRTWETITKKALDEGMWSYAVILHNTECVEYLPNGDIILRSNGWYTPLTAEFIHTHSPFACWKQGGKLWIRADAKVIPINKELRMNWKGEYNYEPAEKVVINKRVLDRDKAKAAREPFKPFLQFAKTMLAISDGWLMHETRKQVLGWKGDKPEDYKYAMDTISDVDLYDVLTAPQHEIDADRLHLQLLCRMNMVHIMEDRHYNEGRREAEKFTFTVQFGNNQSYTRNCEFYDYKINFEKLKRKVYSIVDAQGGVHKIVQVEPTDKGMYNTV